MDGHIHDTCHQVLFQTRNFSYVLKRSSFSPKRVSRHCNGGGKGEAVEGKGEGEERVSHPQPQLASNLHHLHPLLSVLDGDCCTEK